MPLFLPSLRPLFRHYPGLESHSNTLHNFYCPDCNKRFDFDHNLKQHQKSTSHSYCHICERYFACEGAVDNHKRALHTFKCERCGKVFQSEEAETAHKRAKKHWICWTNAQKEEWWLDCFYLYGRTANYIGPRSGSQSPVGVWYPQIGGVTT